MTQAFAFRSWLHARLSEPTANAHAQRVLAFVDKAGQAVPPDGPPFQVTDIPLAERLSCAKLILEEALETIHAMGLAATGEIFTHTDPSALPSLVKVADGLADLSVVTRGAAIRFGIDLDPILTIVDEANLRKFTGDAHRDPETGKWIKPSDFAGPEPQIQAELVRQKALALEWTEQQLNTWIEQGRPCPEPTKH